MTMADTWSKSRQYANQVSVGCRDRTGEFLSVVKSSWSKQSSAAYVDRKRPSYRNDFMLIAKKVGKDIANTTAKLEKLSLVSRRMSGQSSHDSQRDVQQLICLIKQDLSAFNKQIAHLQQMLRGEESSRNSRHRLAHSNAIVVSLQSQLVSMSTEFKSVVEFCSDEMHQTHTRQTTPAHETLYNNQPNTNGHTAAPNSHMMTHSDDSSAGPVVIHIDEMGSGGGQLRQRQQQVQKAVIDDRTESMTSIQQTIVDLGGIFNQMATMVKEQEEMVQRIDTHSDEMYVNVDLAHTEITKYFHSVASNRWLMIKIFGVLAVLFTVFVLLLR